MSTRNFVPRSGSEGQLGTQDKPWGVVVADIGHFATLSGSISGSQYSTGSFGRLHVAGNSNINGDVTIGGNINIGDADTDSLTIAADLTSNLVPNIDSTFDIGTSAKNWKVGHIEQISSTNITASSDISSSGNIFGTNLLADSSSFSTRITTDSSSISTRLTTEEANVDALQSDSASFSTRITNFSTGNVNLVSGSVVSTGSFGHGHIDNQLGVGTQSPDAELHVLGDGVTGAVTSTTGTNKGSIHVGGHGNDNKAMITMGNQFSATTSNPITAIGSHYSGGAGSSLFFGISTSFASGVNRIPLIIGPQAADGQVKIESSGVNIVGNLTSTGNVSGSAASTGSFGRLETAGDIQSDGRIFEQDTSVIDHATAMAIVFGG